MSATLLNCAAPAKLNLFLHVIGRRSDGYHLLQTLFQLIDRGDTLHFSVRDDGAIARTTDIPGVPAQSDLIVRAARLLQHAAGDTEQRRLGADIAIDKILPMGGGLGGGSSDAATTLMVLNHLWQTGFSRGELMDLGAQLGADVPFFIFGENAFAEGIGERLQAVNTPDCWFVVIEPGVSVPTGIIFSSAQLTRDTKPCKITDFSKAYKCFGDVKLQSAKNGVDFKNDLEAVASAHFPAVADAVKWLRQFGDARMTGSGACVFCSFEHESQAREVLQQVPAQWKAWTAKAMRQHPLAALLR
ncbi:MAG: 4-(cytidine 5-diphospho)-2-C-methyl-D-erythritol kinase [Herbaspirillum sp.]|jgi:4-diphosphocytidyl-2-C-methyl-D-erythritol kinase|nr:4-(cytidine 5-diphospho)-2-C-methyl-D-erythritol kinase [Herbaspirillum sp.]